jgi:hypothetical protein
MSNVFTNSLETKSYTLYLSSNDKVSGTNNSATFNINWDAFLPREYDTFKVSFSFQSGGGNYLDSKFSGTSNAASITNGVLTLPTGTSLSTTQGVAAPAIRIGQLISGSGTGGTITSPTYILSYGTASASNVVGTYNITNNGQTITNITNLQGNQVFSGCKIQMNLLGRSYSLDSYTTSPSITLGYAQRDIQTSSSSSNSFSTFYLQFPPKTVSRPTEQAITVNLYNLNYSSIPLVDTDNYGNKTTDSTPWNIILEFVPVLSSKHYPVQI